MRLSDVVEPIPATVLGLMKVCLGHIPRSLDELGHGAMDAFLLPYGNLGGVDAIDLTDELVLVALQVHGAEKKAKELDHKTFPTEIQGSVLKYESILMDAEMGL